MTDHDDGHNALLLVDLVAHAEVTSTGTVFALKIETKRSAHAQRILCQTAVHELDTLLRLSRSYELGRSGP